MPRTANRLPRTIRIACAAVAAAAMVLASGCTAQSAPEDDPTVAITTGDRPDADVVDLPDGTGAEAVDAAVARGVDALPSLVAEALDASGVPGAAVAVVHGGDVLYSEGFGVKTAGESDPVDPDTVFQIASVSKSLSATAVAKAVTEGAVTWTTPVTDELPDFEMADPYVTANATIGDYFAHRSGLATGAGDDLEDIGYDRAYILDHLHLQPLEPFRTTYKYSNFGLTVGAEATAAAVGVSWEDLMDEYVYAPIGMSSSSSRYEDFLAQEDRASLHTLIDGEFQPLLDRDPDPQSPAGGTSSTVTDLAKWMNVVLAGGDLNGDDYIDPAALLEATSGQQISGHAWSPQGRTSAYGFGFNVGSQAGGRTTLSHSGAFVQGAATAFLLIPSLDVGIVTLTNAGPVGVPEALNATFADLVQFGEVTRDWSGDYAGVFAPYYAPVGDLAGETPPADAQPAGDLSDYVGTYQNDYFGALTIVREGEVLVAELGPEGGYRLPLSTWDGDTFAFAPTGENAPAGSLSSATFSRTAQDVTSVTLQFFDERGLGTWGAHSTE